MKNENAVEQQISNIFARDLLVRQWNKIAEIRTALNL